MTAGEAVRRLARAGWRIVRQRGSHLLMVRGDERLVAAVGRRGKHRTSPGQVASGRWSCSAGAPPSADEGDTQ